jgi:hypothetical protein
MFHSSTSPSTHSASNVFNTHAVKPRLFATSRQSYCRLTRPARCSVLLRPGSEARHAAVSPCSLRLPSQWAGISQTGCQLCQSYWSTGQTQRGVLSWFQHGYHASVFQCWWETLPAEGRVKHVCDNGFTRHRTRRRNSHRP